MNAALFVRVCRARWPVLLLGLLVTAGAVLLTSHPQVVYWSRVSAMVMAPVSQTASRTLENQGTDATAAASILATQINHGITQPRAASPDSTLYGEGHRSATSARVRNVGNQWTPQVRDALIDLEVVSPSQAMTREEALRQVASLRAQLIALQVSLRVPEASRLELSVSPPEPVVSGISSSRSRTAGAVFVLGVALSLVLTYWADRWYLRQKRRRGSVPQDRAEPLPGTRPEERTVLAASARP